MEPRIRATTGNDELINKTQATFNVIFSIDIPRRLGCIREVIGR